MFEVLFEFNVLLRFLCLRFAVIRSSIPRFTIELLTGKHYPIVSGTPRKLKGFRYSIFWVTHTVTNTGGGLVPSSGRNQLAALQNALKPFTLNQ